MTAMAVQYSRTGFSRKQCYYHEWRLAAEFGRREKAVQHHIHESRLLEERTVYSYSRLSNRCYGCRTSYLEKMILNTEANSEDTEYIYCRFITL